MNIYQSTIFYGVSLLAAYGLERCIANPCDTIVLNPRSPFVSECQKQTVNFEDFYQTTPKRKVAFEK